MNVTIDGESPWYGRMWIGVPLISFSGVAGTIAGISIPPLGEAGVWGCLIASFLLAYIALKKPKKDIVSFAVPIFALIMFLSPDLTHGLPLQIPFAASITILALRLEKRFSIAPATNRTESESDSEEEVVFGNELEDWDEEES
ncbi:hypothetical protein [Methanothrix sp.]|uniref:hypothetical protein n=1 Tax=Methanothrix sp. TaxID=90426 RepID=UPI0034E2B6D7